MTKQITVTSLFNMKQKGEKIVALTAYDYPFGRIVDECGIHVILVGDSVGNVIQGKANTLPVTMDELIYHTRMVTRAVNLALVVGDMPFMSYQVSTEQAIANAGRFLKEAGATAVKLEGGATVSKTITAISNAGIPVVAHLGLTPQSVHQLGGHKVQRDEDRLMADALEIEAAGAFSVLLEAIPAHIAEKITKALTIPVIGIGAGPHCDGQALVLYDMLGLTDGHFPKFVKQYARLIDHAKAGISQFIEETQTGKFPSEEHCY